MIYLSGVSGPAVRRANHPRLGLLVTRRTGRRWAELDHYPAGWGTDNGCFAAGSTFDLAKYLRWLDAAPGAARARCLFAPAPDVVGDARATWARSAPVLAAIRDLGYPAALVAQNGWRADVVDWDLVDVVFLGGNDAFKDGAEAQRAALDALERGRPVHMGRVNSWSRLEWAAALGCSSVDGNYLRWPDTNLPKLLTWLDRYDGTLWAAR